MIDCLHIFLLKQSSNTFETVNKNNVNLQNYVITAFTHEKVLPATLENKTPNTMAQNCYKLYHIGKSTHWSVEDSGEFSPLNLYLQ